LENSVADTTSAEGSNDLGLEIVGVLGNRGDL
jgi:hypothetical protein